MPWARLDDSFYEHPKVVALLEHRDGPAAIGLWTVCVSWAAKQQGKTQALGHVSGPVMRRVFPVRQVRRLADLLVKHDLFETAGPDDYVIHDFPKYARNQIGPAKAAAAARWGGASSNA